jgi:hypothetical protein
VAIFCPPTPRRRIRQASRGRQRPS